VPCSGEVVSVSAALFTVPRKASAFKHCLDVCCDALLTQWLLDMKATEAVA
jgi:hypothetical protein